MISRTAAVPSERIDTDNTSSYSYLFVPFFKC